MNKVDSVAIYPAIGIARVGNSPDEYFFGSMIPGQPARDKDDFRDSRGRIKRQAAKFFIYALDKEGNVLGELNEENGAKIDWRVDVANKKSAWYQFDIALDTPTAEGKYDTEGMATPDGLPVLSQFRNREYQGDDRKLLMIEARAQNISGKNTNASGGKYQFQGTVGYEKRPVYLGEVRTDEAGRLIFLGGRGLSDSFTATPSPLTTFANNEGWHDDTSDGPVDAQVTLPNGNVMTATGAWVVTAPPNFAVGVQAFSTGYELLLDVAACKYPKLKKAKPEFYEDIYPTLQQLSINQWVNAGVSREFGWGSTYDFNSDDLINRLKDASVDNRYFRQSILNQFRNPDYQTMEPLGWPPLYGDSVTFNIHSTDPRNWFAITDLKYGYLQQWAEGNFEVGAPPQPKIWSEMTPGEQAHGLTEAALEETLGGPFHPGCEFTWPMRHALMYEDDMPFRIKRRSKAKEDFGIAISHEIALSPGGPLDGSSPGDITKWMAVPWQSDTSSCLSAYRTYAGEYLPTFWPARVPNDVLTAHDYKVLNSKQGVDEKVDAFNPDSRKKWLRGYIYNEDGTIISGSSIADRMKGVTKFTEEWYKIGIIVEKEMKAQVPFLPDSVWVETGRFPDLDENLLAPKSIASGEEESYERPKWVDMNPRHLR